MARRLPVFIIFIFLCIPSFGQSMAGDDLFGLISSRIRSETVAMTDLTRAEKTVAEGEAMYRPDGSFSDVDYAAEDRTNWPPMIHIDRLCDFALAYTIPHSKYYGDETLYDMIEKGLSYWYDRNPRCGNWWYNQIGEPQRIGIILLVMQAAERRLPDGLVARTLERMRADGGDPARQAGPNKTDIALHWLYRACLTKDAGLLRQTMEQAFEPLRYTTAEGIQYDNSYFQHGRQFYVVGYGDELLKGVTKFAMYAEGTEFRPDAERLGLFDRFVRETYLKVIRGQYCHFNVMGRGMSRPDATKKEGSVRFCESMAALMPDRAEEYNQAIARLSGEKPADYGVKPSGTVYFTGDYALHVRPRYSFGVRAVSSRTLRNEYGNGENLQTYFISDGSTHIAVAGDEYYNIFPVWDWRRIPGVTAPVMDTVPNTKVDWQTPGTSTFTGGASDGTYSVFTYVYEDNYAGIDTRAKKSWFFFDDEVVCLGADIGSASAFPVSTTVNQCLLKGPVTEEGDWVLHGGVGYVFPEKRDVEVSGTERSGSWRRITAQGSVAEVKKEVFTLRIDHGMRPEGATYAYIVVPDVHTAHEMRKYSAAGNIEILSNDGSCQAVRSAVPDMWQIVFFEAGSLSHEGVSVAADAPCAIIIDGAGSDPVVHVADPGHRQTIINVSVSGLSGKTETIVCDFTDTGVYAGKTKSFVINN